MGDKIFKKNKHGFRIFFGMLWKAKLPYIWIIIYIISSFLLAKVGISATEYTAKMFAGQVDVTTIVLPFLAVILVSFVIGSISGILSSLCKAKIDRNMRRMVWLKTVKLPFGYYDSSNPKELISRIVNDTAQVSNLIMMVFVGVITSAYSIVITLRQIGSYNLKLMVVLIAVLPLNLGIAIIVGKMHFGIGDIVNKKRAKLTEGIAESATNMLLVKSMGTEELEYEKGMEKAKDLYHKTILNSWITSISNPAYTVSGMIQFMVIVLVGRNFYGSGAISLAEWISYFAFANTLVNYLSGYCGNWQTFKASQGATNRIAHLMIKDEENSSDGESVSEFNGPIHFNNVRFAYGDKVIFENLSFTIPEGKITAIIGPSGSGKTTILNLIERFYDIKDGTITIGKDDISIFKLRDYRKTLGYVTQETNLFAGTLRGNLVLEEKFTDETIMKACAAAGIAEFIKKDKNGLDMIVGEGGINLSGGQKQRIAIARILLKQPKYLLLDEGTSAIDIEGKDMVFEGICNRLEGSTTVIVAHDKQTVEKADHLIVLEDGKIVGTGSLDELKHSNGFIRELLGEDD